MTLARGSQGDEVVRLQEALQALGLYRGGLDGDYGRGTFEAVRRFQQRYLVDGIADDLTLDSIHDARAAWEDEVVSFASVPAGFVELERRYGHIDWENSDEEKWGRRAWVRITNDWMEDYLVDADLPVVGTQTVNRVVVPSLTSVLEVVASRGLDGEIKQFGCFAPRHKMHNRNRGLSIHTWAAAVDVNWDTNMPSEVGDLDPGIVQAFEMYGWEWGGRWRQRDDMHFQLATEY